MGALLTEFTLNLRTNIGLRATKDFERRNKNLWWQQVAKVQDSKSQKEVLLWLLETLRIREEDEGSVTFDDMLQVRHEIENKFPSFGLRLRESQMSDLENGIPGGEAIRLAAEWARQAGGAMAYWPQQLLGQAIRDNIRAYDGKDFFATDHSLNPYKPGFGTYANLLNASSLSGAAPAIHATGSGAVTLDTAIDNVQRCIDYIASIKSPAGDSPRGLRVAGLVVPPALVARAQQITNSKFVAQAAVTGGGSADREAVVRNWGFGQPIQADELGSSMGGSNTSWYLLIEGATSDEVGPFIYSVREPFKLRMNTGDTDASLARESAVEWVYRGRNAMGSGHPYLMFRADGA